MYILRILKFIIILYNWLSQKQVFLQKYNLIDRRYEGALEVIGSIVCSTRTDSGAAVLNYLASARSALIGMTECLAENDISLQTHASMHLVRLLACVQSCYNSLRRKGIHL